jgi:hypothetical protein
VTKWKFSEVHLISGVPNCPNSAPLSEDNCCCLTDFFEKHGTAGIDNVDLFSASPKRDTPRKVKGTAQWLGRFSHEPFKRIGTILFRIATLKVNP